MQHGWQESDLMTYTCAMRGNYEIFFDNSNSIEIYQGKIRIESAYLSSINDLIKVLEHINSLPK